ncbi:MAG: flagellar biosynthetic protein FliR [Planctomycetota bacterium]|jgi:flagellar biosynthetic protein FliR
MMHAAVGTDWILTFLLVSVRLGGILLVAPVLGHRTIPVKLRVLLGLVISLGVVGRITNPGAVPASMGELLLMGGRELLIGATIGYAARLIFMGVQLGAFHVAHQMGLSLGEIFNPLAAEFAGTLRSLFGILGIVIFLLIGGHRALIAALLRTFETLPPSPALAHLPLCWRPLRWASCKRRFRSAICFQRTFRSAPLSG